MTIRKHICLLALSWCAAVPVAAQQAVLNEGKWYKFSIEKEGVYRITSDLLRKAGVDPATINPKNIRVFGMGGGMLPQANAAERPAGLTESAILVRGEDDGRFDRADQILFYAEGPDKAAFMPARNIFSYEKNLYSDRNYYFLNIGSTAGKRIGPSASIPGNHPVIAGFEDYYYYELDQYNIERSGREWFGEKFGTTTAYEFPVNMPGIVPGSVIRMVSDVMGQSYTDAGFKVFFNNVSVGDQKLFPIPNGRYSVRGLHKRDTLTFAASDVNASTRGDQVVKYVFTRGTGFSQGYLDYFLLCFTRTLALYGQQTVFSTAALEQAISTFQIGDVAAGAGIWDLTDPSEIKAQEFTLSGGTATFSAATGQVKKMVVFTGAVPEPEFVKAVVPQNLKDGTTPALLIITHPSFAPEAERLAAHRTAVTGWPARVATTEEIYNEFSGGRQDVTAIRDYAKHLWDQHPGALKAILLFGKGSYDYKDRIPNNTNFVPTYQSRNSLHPLQTYSSDDYFAFLEDEEGWWGESPAQHHTLDIGVGRLPVTTVAEASDVVDKIIYYETYRDGYGSWRKKIVFVADDGNGEDGFTSLHQYQADQLANDIVLNHPDFDTRKLFMGSYKKIVQPNGEFVPEMADDIIRAFEQGVLIVNFTGHGSELVWTDERVFTEKTIAGLTNKRYPFLVTATCEFGRQDDPHLVSSAERIVLRPGAGAIGLVTTARPVNATTNFSLNDAFYQALLKKSPDGYAHIGKVFMDTKNNSTSGVANRNFSLIGDPSMVLAMPPLGLDISEVVTPAGTDTLKALTPVTIRGHVTNAGGAVMNTFSGIVEVTLLDKPVDYVTIGKNNPPFAYQQRSNALFRGAATVHDGEFELSFVMPKNIAYQIGPGKFSLYAYDAARGTDAKGDFTVPVGGSEKNTGPDTTPPEIKLFIGDDTFVSGGITTPDTDLVAILSDESGINISGYGIGNSIVAQLDGDREAFVLNDYYVSDPDTHRQGTIRFPLLRLEPGKHTLVLRAWDVHNNPAKASVDFVVTDGGRLVIESFGNYPNPFQDNTTLFFTHNRSGDDLEARLFIFSLTGELIHEQVIAVPASHYQVELARLNLSDPQGKKLQAGLYLARLIVRSVSNGSKNEQVTKLIVLD